MTRHGRSIPRPQLALRLLRHADSTAALPSAVVAAITGDRVAPATVTASPAMVTAAPEDTVRSLRRPGARTTTETPYMYIYIYKGQKPESDILPSYRATRRYTKVNLGFCLRFSTLIGQIGRAYRFSALDPGGTSGRGYSGWPSPLSGVPLPLPGGKEGKRKQRSFLGPFARQNCLRILCP